MAKRENRSGSEGGLTDEPRLEPGVEEVRRLPLHSEAARTVIRQVQRGEVRIHKRVRTELRQLSIPVRIEELVVERLPAGARSEEGADTSPPRAETQPLSAPFVEGAVHLELLEERVEVTLHPVVRELVTIRKSVVEERTTQEVLLRHEEATVERTGTAEVSDEGEPGGTRH